MHTTPRFAPFGFSSSLFLTCTLLVSAGCSQTGPTATDDDVRIRHLHHPHVVGKRRNVIPSELRHRFVPKDACAVAGVGAAPVCDGAGSSVRCVDGTLERNVCDDDDQCLGTDHGGACLPRWLSVMDAEQPTYHCKSQAGPFELTLDSARAMATALKDPGEGAPSGREFHGHVDALAVQGLDPSGLRLQIPGLVEAIVDEGVVVGDLLMSFGSDDLHCDVVQFENDQAFDAAYPACTAAGLMHLDASGHVELGERGAVSERGLYRVDDSGHIDVLWQDDEAGWQSLRARLDVDTHALLDTATGETCWPRQK